MVCNAYFRCCSVLTVQMTLVMHAEWNDIFHLLLVITIKCTYTINFNWHTAKRKCMQWHIIFPDNGNRSVCHLNVYLIVQSMQSDLGLELRQLRANQLCTLTKKSEITPWMWIISGCDMPVFCCCFCYRL